MILDLRKVLTEQEGLKATDKLCPLLSRFGVNEKPMSKDLEFMSFAVLCLEQNCGQWSSCGCPHVRPERAP